MILVGDIGGTKARLALYDASLQRRLVESYSCREYTNLEAILRQFADKHDVRVERACFGVPGPVIHGRAEATNLPWKLDEKTISATLGVKKVKLVNDLVATTSAVPHLRASELVVLHPGVKQVDRTAARAVLAPGTGLGQAYLIWDGERYVAHASEGGHVDFAPTNDLEIELYRYLHEKYARVSLERIYCGPGLLAIFTFLQEVRGIPVPHELQERMRNGDQAAVISQTGLSGEFDICVQTMDLFVTGLGIIAGNLVLTYLATGGVYLGGGIPPKILPLLRDKKVVQAYLNKGRLSNLVEDTPLYVIADDHVALLGAAHLAARL